MIGVIDVIQKQQTGKGFGDSPRYCLDHTRDPGHDAAPLIAPALPRPGTGRPPLGQHPGLDNTAAAR